MTIAGWTVANLACEMFGFFHPDRYLRVRYEDLVRTPVKVLGRIFARVALDPPTTLEPTATRTNRHQLYGTAMRFETLSPAELREDAAWKTAMPLAYRRLVGSLYPEKQPPWLVTAMPIILVVAYLAEILLFWNLVP